MKSTTIHNQVNFYLLASIVIFYPFSLKLCNAVIIACAIHWLFWLASTPGEFYFKDRMMWLMVTPFILGAISLLYTSDLKTGIFVIEKKIVLLILPLVLGTIPKIGAKRLDTLIFVGCGAVLVASVFCLVMAVYRAIYGLPGGFYWKELTRPLSEFHPTYYALTLNFFMVYLGVRLLNSWTEVTLRIRCLYVLIILFLLLFVVLLSSKIQLVFSLLILIYLVVKFVKAIKLRIVFPIIFIFVAMLIWHLKDGYAWERFGHITTLKYELNGPVETFNELTIRFAIAECSWSILKHHLIFGVGVGDVKSELDKAYRKFDYKFGYLDQQNPHNEYLSQFLSVGLVGLIVFVITLVAPGILANNYRHDVYLIFLILISVSFLFESLLERQKGIVFYSFFNSLFLFHFLPRLNKDRSCRSRYKNPMVFPIF